MPPKRLLTLRWSLFVILAIVAGAGKIYGDDTISLAGQWRFQLDPENAGVAGEWFSRKLPDAIELPGSCEQRGFGNNPEKSEELRLTHVLKYVGPAWYQREIEIPAAWSGKRVELFLERCHWETTVWVDGRKIGMQNSLSVPHRHDLGTLAPGRHTLTVCVDNTYKLRIGTWAHAITEDTQGNWNGIIGGIELRATDPVWIRSAQVFPGKIKVSVGNQTARALAGKIAGSTIQIPAAGGEFEIPFARSAEEAKWDEFSTVMHTLDLKLEAGSFSDTKKITYGLSGLTAKDKQFVLNGRPTLLRGPVDECVYPLTGYPPMDKAGWKRVLGICKSYGFNFMRFHSWCPPEAAFAAADELGFLFQVELPVWTMDAPQFGDDPPRDQFIRDELARILETYGNHPSFALMAMGNESGGALDTLVKSGRAQDSRRLFRCEGGQTAADGDYSETGQRGVFGPLTDWDRWSVQSGWIAGGKAQQSSTGPSVPTLAHEVGQWEMYPDLDGIKKYTGTLRANYLERYRDSLEAHHMLDQADAFQQASGKFMVELYKDEIEGGFRSWPYGGFEILEARDYTGQGVATVGWLDAFWDSKGLIAPEKFREFCAPTVCLLRMPKRVFSSEETFSAKAQLAHYGAKPVEVNPVWKIKDDAGRELAGGKLPSQAVPTGRVATLGDISVPLDCIHAATRLTVTLSAGGTSNSWHIWVYPPVSAGTPANVRVVHAYDQATRSALAAGERVVLFSSPTDGVIDPQQTMFPPESVWKLPSAQPGRNAIPGSFLPVFWSTRLFNQIGTLSLLCDPKHPALAEFPTENHSDWQWADLLGNFSAAGSFKVAGAPPDFYEPLARGAKEVTGRSKAIILDDAPAEFRPIVQMIDNPDRNSKLGVIFETHVGSGKLLVCALDLDTDLAARPAVQQLRRSLLDYAASDKFSPAHELPPELLERLLGTDTSVIKNSSFEAPVVVGWKQFGSGSYLQHAGSPLADNGKIPDGSNVMGLMNGAGISQVLDGLTPGANYTLSLSLNARAGTDKPTALVTIGGNTACSNTVEPVGGSNAYKLVTYSFTAASPSVTLVISNATAAGIDSSLLVDDVHLVSTPSKPLKH